MDKLRVQGERGNGIVGIAVLPRVGHHRIVDRQELDEVLPGRRRPVDHFLNVMELADAETVGGAERKDRNGRPGAPPGNRVQLGDHVFDQKRRPLRGNGAAEVVLSFFPAENLAALAVDDKVLIFEGLMGLDGGLPVRETAVVQDDTLLPLPQRRAAAGKGERFPGADLRGDGPKDDIPLGHRDSRLFAAENDVSESGGPEGRIRRPGGPAVVQLRLPDSFRKPQHVAPPLGADGHSAADQFIGIALPAADFAARKRDFPHPAAAILHAETALSDPQDELLAPHGPVLNRKMNGHSLVLLQHTKVRDFLYFCPL